MSKVDYDFAGWVTKNDTKCSDGLVIKQDAFKESHSKKVPLVWNHNYDSPDNVVGHMLLENKAEGMYGYGYFNNTEVAKNAKELVRHGDIVAMSMGARKLRKVGQNVIHGLIYEVSLVMAGANPGALIDYSVTHSEDGDVPNEERAIIYNDQLIHSADTLPGEDDGDMIEDKEDVGSDEKDFQHADKVETKTVGQIMDTLNEEQLEAVKALIGNIIDEEDENNDLGDDKTMKQNIFDGKKGEEVGVLTHAEKLEIFEDAKKLGSLKESFIQHGITNIELLFPEAKLQGDAPYILHDRLTAGQQIFNATRKSPFSKIKNLVADLTEDEARAKGYVKGNEKFEQVFSLMTRSTGPQTVYKKQKLDRDDIIDITDFDIVAFIQKEMRMMLIEEIARALMVGDGRLVTSPDKIKEEHIRPIVTDADLYTLKYEAAGVGNVIETVIKAMALYEGSGAPSMYMSHTMLADLKLMKNTQGNYLFGDIPTAESIATRFGVKEIVPTSFFTDQILIVNLQDYTLGATKGGEITTFDDFDIDFNQYKYLIETRLSGALTQPHSAIVINVTDAPTPLPPVETDPDEEA